MRASYLNIGASIDAICSMLDIVRIRFDAAQDVRDLCADLVNFPAAGFPPSGVPALDYLRKHAELGSLTTTKITCVRTYIGELTHTPDLAFAKPNDDEES